MKYTPSVAATYKTLNCKGIFLCENQNSFTRLIKARRVFFAYFFCCVIFVCLLLCKTYIQWILHSQTAWKHGHRNLKAISLAISAHVQLQTKSSRNIFVSLSELPKVCLKRTKRLQPVHASSGVGREALRQEDALRADLPANQRVETWTFFFIIHSI